MTFKDNAPFIGYISKINNKLNDNAEDIDTVMPMYNSIEYSRNYSKATWSLLKYYIDEPNSGTVEGSIKGSKSFDYKTSITARLEGRNTEKEVEIVVPLKHFINFWKTLNIPLINSEINLVLTWSENFVIISKAAKDDKTDADPVIAAVNNPTDAVFKIIDTKLYVPVVILSMKMITNY